MKLLTPVFCTLICFLLAGCLPGDEPKSCACDNPNATAEELFEEIQQTHNVPALSGLISRQGNTIESAHVGQRDVDFTTRVEQSDVWHLGSITKSMTATLTARLVDLGVLNWEDTLEQLFNQESVTIPGRYKNVTVLELLSHRAGFLGKITNLSNWNTFFNDQRDITSQRLAMAQGILSESKSQPGQYKYTNAGYVVLGSILEQITQQSWEDLIQTHLFEPLDIRDAGFGAPVIEAQSLTQPLGHLVKSARLTSVSPDHIAADNPKAMGPAGTVHMSKQSLLQYAQMHLDGMLGQSDFLSKQSFTKLHTPQFGGDYALGWFTEGNSISHMGTNTMWYAKLGIDSQRKLIVIALTNVGGERGDAATDDVINNLLKRNG